MRVPVIVLSLVSAVAIVVLGGFLNTIFGFGIDVASPYTDPVRVLATFFGAAPGFLIALTGLGFALYDAARRGGLAWFIGLLAWPFIPLLAASLMFAGVLAYPDYWFLPLALVPLAPLLYAFIAPPPATIPAIPFAIPAVVPPVAPTTSIVPTSSTTPATDRSLATSWSRLAVFVGILAVVIVGGLLLLFPSPQPSTGTQTTPPALRVTQPSAFADCATGSYPPVTLANTGAQTLQWTASSEDPNVTASPSGGSLASGATVTVSLSGKTSAPDVIVQFQVGGQAGGTAKFGCQAGTGK